MQRIISLPYFNLDRVPNMKLKLCCCLLIGMFVSSSAGWGDNWPQWRGPDFSNVSPETSLPTRLDTQAKGTWRFELPGPAGASPVVWGERIFLTSIVGTDDGAPMLLICVGTDGIEKWRRTLEGSNQNSRDSANSASPSPCTDGQHVWVMMSNGVLSCFTVDGEPVWTKDLQKIYGKFNIQFGMTSSPILDNGRLYLALMHGEMKSRSQTSEGHVFALDAKTGEEIWYHRRQTDGVSENTHSYASPLIYRDDKHEYLITHGADYVIGHSLKDGSEIWRCGGINPKGSSYNYFLRFVASPGIADGIIVVPTAKRGPVLALKPDLEGDITNDKDRFHWRMDRGTPDVASPLIYQGLVYLAGERGILTCVDAGTGESLYDERILPSQHRSTPVGADGHVYIACRDGKVLVVKVGREFELASETELNEETTASPAIANGRVYIRTFNSLWSFGN